MRKVPLIPKILICLMILLLTGSEISYGGWISSYAVIANIADKQYATIFGILFQVVMTVFRFILCWIPGSPSKKLLFFTIGTCLTFVSTVFIIDFYSGYVAIFYSAIMYGIMTSVAFPLIFSIPVEFGFDVCN